MSKKNNAGTSALINMINTLIEEKTFTGEAITAIASLREHAREAEEEVMELSVHIEDLKRERARLFDGKAKLAKQLATVQGKNEILTDEVAKTNQWITQKLVAEAKAATYENCFDKVFRNVQVHRKVTNDVSESRPWRDDNGCIGTDHFHNHTTEEVTEESK